MTVSAIALSERTVASTATRLVSVDVMRGVTIAFMILVNNPGDGRHAYPQLEHAFWNGWTATDLVFPTFLFLVGVSIVLAFNARLARGASKKSLFIHTLRRTAILFLLGLVVNGFPYFHWGTLRIYGVLQRIAICYLLASAIYLWDRRVGSKIAIIVIALLGYWALLRWVPIPGLGMPGRDFPLFDPRANLTAYIDRQIFPGRLYVGFRDPEGLLSMLPSLATTLLGVLTGMWLRSQRSASQKAAWMSIAGVASVGLGLFWNLWFPINKNLWSSSFVLFAAGCSILLLSICYWAVEIKQWRRGWTYFWVVMGTNAITVYVLSELLSPILHLVQVHGSRGRISLHSFLFLHVFTPVHDLAFASLLFSICFVVVCFVPIAILYHKKIFIKV
jgi:predicted acyltransferase